MDWLDLLAVQGTQESSPTPQFKSINSLVLSFLYTPTLTSIHDYWKNHRQSFVVKVMSLLFNMLSRLVITVLPKSKCLLISWLWSPSAVILEPPKIKSLTMSGSNCCFLTCIQIFQETGQVVWYSHLFKNFPQFVVIHTVNGFGIVNKAQVDVFSGTLLFFL